MHRSIQRKNPKFSNLCGIQRRNIYIYIYREVHVQIVNVIDGGSIYVHPREVHPTPPTTIATTSPTNSSSDKPHPVSFQWADEMTMLIYCERHLLANIYRVRRSYHSSREEDVCHSPKHQKPYSLQHPELAYFLFLDSLPMIGKVEKSCSKER